MYRVLIVIVFLFVIAFTGCSKASETAPPANTNAQVSPTVAASPAASPGAMGVASTLAMPSPGASTAPSAPLNLVTPTDGNKQAKTGPQPLPPAIGDRLRRALTLEEINQLPPETRDAILRAQGRLPASPSPAAKKK